MQSSCLNVLGGIINKRKIAAMVSFVFLLFTLFSSATYAADTPIYTYKNLGTEISATGGAFGSDVIKFTQTAAGANTYNGEKQVSFDIPSSGWLGINWFGQFPEKTGQCVAKMQITVGSDKKSGSIKTLEPQTYIGAKDSTFFGDCSADMAPSDFNQANITITGSVTDLTPTQSTYETENTKQISVTVYSNKKPSDLPEGIKVTLKNNEVNQSLDVSFVGSESRPVDQKFFKGISPGTYTVCITPDNIFDFKQCQSVAKEVGEVAYVTFGSSDTVYYVDGKAVKATVKIEDASGQKEGSYGPIEVILNKVVNNTRNQISKAQTNTKPVNGGTSSTQTVELTARFDTIEPGKYEMCISDPISKCSDAFEKKVNTLAEAEIDIPADKAALFFKEKSNTSCSVEGIGWIVCPTLNFLGKVSDTAFNFLASSFLETNVSLLNTDPNKGTIATYNAWQVMRNIANIAFVIAFLIIIFSQLTSIGITNYGVKKMLPRLIIAAILVNLSFFLCQIAVDISNILGYSLKNVFDSLQDFMQTPNIFSPGDASGNGFGIAALVLAGLAGGITLLFTISVPVLLSVLVALLMIVIILVARTSLIILLVVISPLAFVAFLLPNTEQYFKKWGKMFTNLLLVFPIISVLFGAGALAGAVIKASAGENKVMQLVAIGVAIAPLYAVPSLLKNSVNAVGSIGTKLANLSSKANARVGGKIKETSRLGQVAKNYEAQSSDRRSRIATGTYRGWGGRANPRNLTSSFNRWLNKNAAYNIVTAGLGAKSALAGQVQAKKDVSEAMSMFNGDEDIASAWALSGGNNNSANYAALTATQKEQFDKMRAAGHHKKSTSHLAAVQFLSENGKGTATEVNTALLNAQRSGASALDIDNSRQSAIAAYRSSGRGDAVAELDRLNGGVMTNVAGWRQVSSSNVNRTGLTNDLANYTALLNTDETKASEALSGYSQMEARAQGIAEPVILAAAATHAANKFTRDQAAYLADQAAYQTAYAAAMATGVAPPAAPTPPKSPPATFGSIQEAKTYFGIK